MANEDLNQIKASFSSSKELAAELISQLEQNIALARSVGNEVEVARLEAQKTEIAGGQYVRETPQIEKDTAALQAENRVRREGLDIELQKLEVLKAQAEAQRAASGLYVAPERRAGSYEQLAGPSLAQQEAMLAAEAEAARLRQSLIVPTTGRGGSYENLAGRQAAREAAQAEADAVARQLAEERAVTEQLTRQAALRQQSLQQAHARGFAVGSGASAFKPGEQASIISGPQGAEAEAIGGIYSKDEQALARYNLALGQYEGYASRAALASEALSADLTRLGMVQAEASNAMREHGALTTEWLTALARGETTVSEFGYQIGATVGKFAGWTAAASLTFGALGAITEFGKGAIDSSNGVQQLKRTIDDVNTQKAAEQFRQLSAATDVSIGEASNAVFQFSRTFHDQDQAVAVARLGLSAYQLDNVQLADSVKLSTVIHQQYGYTVSQLGGVYNMLASAQREYNARLSDMVPLLQKSSGAVKNAGGDLTQLIQLGTVATRITQLSGSQVGTAFYRGAATFTPQNAAALSSRFGLGNDINPLTGQGDFTKLLIDAIKESATMPAPERVQLSKAIFGSMFGGRFSALFSPQSAALLEQVSGTGPTAITPQATQGALQKELDVQLQQTRKELDQFVNGLQRVGSALASTGALAPLGLLLRGAVGGLNDLTRLLDVFTQLPGPVREVLSTFLELRLAMLFFSRTRFGSSAPGITNIPGFRPSEATLARGELATGTRAALQQIEQDLGRTIASTLTLGAKQVELEAQRRNLIAEAGGEEQMSADQLEASNAISAKIVALKAEQTRLEEQQLAQEAARSQLNAQMVGLTATTRRLRWSDSDVLALKGATGIDTAGATDQAAGEMGIGQLAMARASAAKAKLTAALRRDTTATTALAVGEAETTAAATAGAAAADAATLAAATETTALEATRVSLGALNTRVMGFVAALDPLTTALIALPFAYSLISSAISSSNQAADSARVAMAQPTLDIAQLQAKARDLSQAAAKQRAADFSNPQNSSSVPGLGWLESHVAGAVQNLFGFSPGDARATQQQADRLRQVASAYESYAKTFEQDAQGLIQTQAGRQKLYQITTDMKILAANVAGSELAGHPQAIKESITAFSNTLQQIYETMVNTSKSLSGSGASVFGTTASVAPKTMEQHIQALDDQSKIYGTHTDSLKQAALYYAALANQYRNTTDDTSLQAVATAQQNFTNAVNKNVQDLLHSATLAPTDSGQLGKLNAAIALLRQERTAVEQAFAAAIAYAKQTGEGMQAIKALQDAEQQMLSQLADLHKQVIDQALQLVKSEAAVQTSSIQGISPEADIQRAESTLAGLRQQLSFAQSHGADAQTINDLTSQLNDARNSLFKQQVTNARGILDAQGKLGSASITGISPQDDIARAQAAVTAARNLLSFDQSHGAGESQILQDQASLDQSIYQLNQSIQQHDAQMAADAKAYIDAQAAFAESQTTSGVAQAREQLAADIKAIGLVRPQDYKTYQEYQTALLQAKATAGKEQQTLRQQIVDTDMRTLQYELHTQQITDQQYVDGLQQLLKMKKLTLQERQDIGTQIFDTLHQTAVDLNVGSIKLPTTYEVRRALQAGLRAARGGAPANENAVVVHHTVTNNVRNTFYVSKDSDLKKVADTITKAITQVGGQAQAAGVI